MVESVQGRGGQRVRGDLGSKSRGLSAGADLLVVRYEFSGSTSRDWVRSGCFLTLSSHACICKWTYYFADLVMRGQARWGDGDHRVIFQESPRGDSW